MSRESRLSEILQYYETNKSDPKISMKLMPIFPCKLFDIFDEIDALMTALKSYIFSIGETEQLPSEKIRLELLRQLIEIFLKKHLKKSLENKIVTTDETEADTFALVDRGEYPPGLRLNFGEADQKFILEFRKDIAKDIMGKDNHYFAFTSHLSNDEFQNLVEYVINPLNKEINVPEDLSEQALDQLNLLRGALGYGIFEHCLSMRCGVDYGAPNKFHKKRIAVPYEAADIPSKTSQYQQPDVSTVLSYLAYYTKGLTQEQFNEALKNLLCMSKTSKEIEYE